MRARTLLAHGEHQSNPDEPQHLEKIRKVSRTSHKHPARPCQGDAIYSDYSENPPDSATIQNLPGNPQAPFSAIVNQLNSSGARALLAEAKPP